MDEFKSLMVRRITHFNFILTSTRPKYLHF